MWLWILGILVIIAAWAVWLLFPPDANGVDFFPTWVPIVITAVVLAVLIGLFVIRRIRAARAARALEKAIAQQAQEQALQAKPEDRAEIQALNRQLAEGIASLKASKLADGSTGDSALYALPWYVIVGPPGAGKTTALKHSGLVFPFLDATGSGVRGVGGTRNCDWWFTNEAIMLDTAGRYTTESEDRDEWVAFLESLLKFRPDKPINGVVVAVSVAELLDATDDSIQTMAGKVRARIDEMQETLKMTLPVYVLFTKADLVAGFVEFFGDLKKSERGQPWGATFRLDAPKGQPGKRFEEEFDLLVQQLHQRGVRRLNVERSRRVKEKIYQFPLEFAAIKRNLADFVQAAFLPTATGNAKEPIFRGVYFTSGTQEGKPLDRVVGGMARAFGLRGEAEEEAEEVKEGRSYFLKDLFQGIIFPDQTIADLTDTERRRRRLQKVAIAAAAALVSLLIVVPAILSFMNNRELVRETDAVSQSAAGVAWRDPNVGVIGKVQKLDALRDHTSKLKDWSDNGAPFFYGFGMYQGDKLYAPAKKQYVESLNQGFLRPSRGLLEEKVKNAKGDPYLPDYNALKAYLLLDEVQRLKDESLYKFEVEQLTNTWAEVLLPTAGNVNEADLKAKLFPHVEFFVKLLRDGDLQNFPVEKPLVESARLRLQSANQEKAYYELFVLSLLDRKLDENAPSSADNLLAPPIHLEGLFTDRTEVLDVLSSRQKRAEGKPREVRGPYTGIGRVMVMKALRDGVSLLEREQWVVPFSRDEKKVGDRIKVALARTKQRYEDDFIQEWEDFFRDIETKIPANNKEAIAEFRTLSTPEWPYQRLLRTLDENTLYSDPSVKPKGFLGKDGGIVDQIALRMKRRLENEIDVELDELQNPDENFDRIRNRFKSMISYGIAPPPPESNPAAPPTAAKPGDGPGINKYINHLETLGSKMQIIEEGPANTDTKETTEMFSLAVQETEAQLSALDTTGQLLMNELLMNPLRQSYKAAMASAGGAASGLWEVEVWPTYREKIKNRYPFALTSNRDASYDDVVAFFKPKDGILWGFYETHLAQMHRKQNHDFIPIAHLQGGAKGVPFSPFKSAMYPCLKRADEITDALWGGSKVEGPQVKFRINLKTVSPIVSDVIFEIDGQKRQYRNEKEFWYEFNWPGEEGAKGARMQVRGAGGLDEEIVREGPWGVFRLFESADEITALKDDDNQFLVTWTMAAPPVTVTMQVKPTRGNHPFPLSFFRNTNCPPSIGDKFGKGS